MRFFAPLAMSLLLLLSACADEGRPARYDLPANPGGRLCVFQCREANDHCKDACSLKQRACTNDMQAQAIKDYEDYTRDQFMAHAPVELRPSDFERPELCVPSACLDLCQRTYDRCFVNCGGKIER